MAALVLLSGGLDSTVAAALHQAQGHRLAVGLFVDYGQRAALQERAAAEAVAGTLGFELLVTSLPLLARSTRTALVNPEAALPTPSAAELDAQAQSSADAVWVPNRNAVLVHLAAAVAEGRGLDQVVVGFNAEEAVSFPDNGAPFVERLNATLELSTRGAVQVVAPTLAMTKAQLLRAGLAVGAPVAATWSCYAGGTTPCGRCESCLRRARAEA